MPNARLLVSAVAAAVLLVGCGTDPEKRALAGRVSDLRAQLNAALARADASVADVDALGARLEQATAERDQALADVDRLETLLTTGNGARADAEMALTELTTQIGEAARAAGASLGEDAGTDEALAALAESTAALGAREAQATETVAAASRAVVYLRAQVERMAAEARAGRASLEAQRDRIVELTEAMTQARGIVNEAVARARFAEEDNLALSRANEMLRQQTAVASMAAQRDGAALAQLRSAHEAAVRARDYHASRSNLFETRVADLEASGAAVDERLAATGSALEEAQAELAEKTATADRLAGQLADTLAERDALRTEIGSADERVADLTLAQTRSDAERNILKAQTEAARNANAALQTELANRTEAFNALRETTNQLRARVDIDQRRAKDVDNQLAAARKGAADLRRQLEASLTAKDAMAGSLATARESEAAARAEIATLTQRVEASIVAKDAMAANLAEARRETDAAMNEVKALEQRVEASIVAKDAMAENLAEARREADAAKAEAQTLADRAEASIVAKNAMAENLAEARGIAAEARAATAEMETALAAARTAKDAMATSLAEERERNARATGEAASWSDTLNAALLSARARLDERAAALAEATARIDDLEGQLEGKRTQVAALADSKAGRISEANRRVQALDANVQQLRELFETTRERLQNAVSEAVEQRQLAADAAAALEKMTAERDELARKLAASGDG